MRSFPITQVFWSHNWQVIIFLISIVCTENKQLILILSSSPKNELIGGLVSQSLSVGQEEGLNSTLLISVWKVKNAFCSLKSHNFFQMLQLFFSWNLGKSDQHLIAFNNFTGLDNPNTISFIYLSIYYLSINRSDFLLISFNLLPILNCLFCCYSCLIPSRSSGN